MFKEKRIIYKNTETPNDSSENSKIEIYSNRCNEIQSYVNDAQDAIYKGQTAATEAKNVKSKEGENPTQKLDEQYDKLWAKMNELSTAVDNNVNDAKYKALLDEFEKDITTYKELTKQTQDYADYNKGELAKSEENIKKENKEQKKQEESNKEQIVKAEENIKKVIVEGGISKSNKKQIEEAVNELAAYLKGDDPRREVQYWTVMAREEGKIDEWKAQYGGKEVASSNI